MDCITLIWIGDRVPFFTLFSLLFSFLFLVYFCLSFRFGIRARDSNPSIDYNNFDSIQIISVGIGAYGSVCSHKCVYDFSHKKCILFPIQFFISHPHILHTCLIDANRVIDAPKFCRWCEIFWNVNATKLYESQSIYHLLDSKLNIEFWHGIIESNFEPTINVEMQWNLHIWRLLNLINDVLVLINIRGG